MGVTSTAPTYGVTKPISSETWTVPVSRLRRLGTTDPRVALLRNTVDQMKTDTVLISVERYREPVDYSNEMIVRSDADVRSASADTFITISERNGGLAAWRPADYAKVKDLLALLPTPGSKTSSSAP